MTIERRSILIAILAVGAIYTGVIMMLPDNAFWITDGGNKFIIIRNLASHGTSDIVYPGAEIDPDAAFFPYAGFHFRLEHGRIRSFYPSFYPALCVPWLKAGGITGILMFTALSALIVLAITGGISGMITGRASPGLTVLVLGLATPFFFYSVVLWEHMLAMIFSTFALWLLFSVGRSDAVNRFSGGGRYAAAGIMLAVSCVFREESYILFGSLGLALLLSRRARFGELAVFGLAWFLPMLPLWFYQYSASGHLLGSHAAGYHALARLESNTGLGSVVWSKLSNFYVFLFKFQASAPPPDLSGALSVLPALFLVVTASVYPPERQWHKKMILVLLFWSAIAALFHAVLMFRNPEPVLNTLFTQALLTGVPLLLILFPTMRRQWRESSEIRLTMLTWSIYALCVCLFLNQGELGLIRGPRHFLPLLPLLVPVAADAFFRLREDWRPGVYGRIAVGAAVALLVASFAIQIQSITALYAKKSASAQIVNTLERLPSEVIVSDVFWLGEDCAAIFHRKKFMNVNSGEELERLTGLLGQHGVERFALVLSGNPQYRKLTNPAIAELLRRAVAVSQQTVVSPRAGFMGLIVTEFMLAPPAPDR